MMVDSQSSVRGHLTALIIVGGLILLAQGWQVFHGVSVTPQQWQYTIESPKDDDLSKRLDQLGAEGWEVVSARRATSSVEGQGASYEMIMRRPFSSASTTFLPVPPPQ